MLILKLFQSNINVYPPTLVLRYVLKYACLLYMLLRALQPLFQIFAEAANLLSWPHRRPLEVPAPSFSVNNQDRKWYVVPRVAGERA